jgi:hypothetical protein
MLATRFDRCQGNRGRACRWVPKLSACSKHVASPALAEECIDAGLAEHRLELKDIAVSWAVETASGKFIERDEIHFALDIPQQGGQPLGVGGKVIDPGQEDVFKRQAAIQR